MRAVGYFRENSEGSLAEQSRAFLEFCRTNGYEAAAAFLDTARQDDNLPGYRQLLEFLKHQGQRGFLMVAIPGLKTLGIGLPEATRHYFQLSSLGVQVVSIAGGCDPGSSLLEIWSSGGEGEGIGQRVRMAMRRKAVKGEALGRPPYGYRVGPKRRLQIVPEEGSVVRYLFRLYLKDGLGIRRIARRLNQEGLHTRRGGLWSMVTVRDILRNRAYVGTYSRFGVRVPASHQPIIAPDDFRMVQERLDQRRPNPGSRELSPFLLSGLVYCSYCGNKMIGVTRKQRWQRRNDGAMRSGLYRYYQCESRTNRSLCDYHTQRAEELEGRVRRSLLGEGEGSKPVVSDEAATLAEAEGHCRRLRSKLRRLNRRLEQNIEAAIGGRITEERLRSLSLTLAAEQLQIEESLEECQRSLQQQTSRAERRRQRQKGLARLRDEWDSLDFAPRRELLQELIDRIVVRDDGIEIMLRF